MMKQRIVLKMDVSDSEKSMKKAMKIASGKSGVKSVTIQGQNDQLVLVGEGIDLAELIRVLKKKVCHTSIVTVQAAPPQQPPQSHPHMSQYNQMPPAIRCTCEIPNSGFCGLCTSTSQHTYYTVPSSPYPPPVIYYRDEPDGCIIM